MSHQVMRLIMLGTGLFAVPTLRALAAGRHDVQLVGTRPPRGPGHAPASPMRQAALELGLPIWTPKTVNSSESHARLSALAADLLVVCDYGEILKPATLATTRLGGINLHGSLLPKYRGAAPVQWAILRGETETGVSVIQMTAGLDAGPCLAQESTPIGPEETAQQLEARLAEMGAGLICRVVDQLAAGAACAVRQDPSLASKAPRLKKEFGVIDWSRSAQQIKDQIRGLIPWPRAFTFWHRTSAAPLRLNVDRASVVDPGETAAFCGDDASPGTVLAADRRLIIRTGDGVLEILNLQPAGKRSMQAEEFLRGNRVQQGERFGPIG